MISSVIKYFKSQKLSILKTILINFKSLPFKQAIKFPIYVYRDSILKSIGLIKIEAPISRGMIKIGVHNFYAAGVFQLINSGTIIFRGKCLLNGGSCICNVGIIDIGTDVMLGENLNIMTVNKLIIGDYARIAFGCVIMDSNFHSVINTKTGVLKRTSEPVHIGAYVWIGNRTTIMKGCVIPDFTITTTTSYLNKDYSGIEPYSLLAGSPAKVVATGIRRVYNNDSNSHITKYFADNIDAKELVVDRPAVESWDDYCFGGDEYLFTH